MNLIDITLATDGHAEKVQMQVVPPMSSILNYQDKWWLVIDVRYFVRPVTNHGSVPIINDPNVLVRLEEIDVPDPLHKQVT